MALAMRRPMRQHFREAEAIADDQQKGASRYKPIILSAVAHKFGAEYDGSESDEEQRDAPMKTAQF